ncbi:15983_t:CDS:2 [Gigaspora margarita]|uniref:15983_t:CDS:1 n=1 Tax=Gigaspora margarita TaxID=4874 RepID=A0ABM8W705_GIGMA|nr:15983_t:CDS:2 [Gigaspora margarita]
MLNTSEMHEDLDDLYQNYELYLTKALKIVQEQKVKQNYSFARLQKMITDVEPYKRRITNPRTWKDYNHHTMFWQ